MRVFSWFTLCVSMHATLGATYLEAQDGFDGFDDEFATPEPDVADQSEVFAAQQPSSKPWVRRFRKHNALVGSVGGLRVIDAGSAKTGTFRLQLHTEFFFASDFLENNDSNEHIGGALSLSVTPLDFLEIYASVKSYANSNNKEDPSLFQVLGDSRLGIKGFYEILPGITLGGDLQLGILNTVGDIGVVLDSTSVGLRVNASADLRALYQIPLLARLNLQYYFDNSENLIEDIEQKRYASLNNPAPIDDENRHLISRVERFALDINRTDFLNIGLGFEAPLQVLADLAIHPMLEWTWAIPINRQGYTCLFVRDPADPESPFGGDDSCLGQEGILSHEMDLTLGVRVLPPVTGLSLFAAVDIGLTGTGTFVRELSGNAPYNIMLGAGYAYDPKPPERVVYQDADNTEVSVASRLRGMVLDEATTAPIAGATITFQGTYSSHNALISHSDGSFNESELADGSLTMQITHPDYETTTCSTVIAEPDAHVTCALKAGKRSGSIGGTITDDTNQPVSIPLTISGQKEASAESDSAGNFNVENLPAGDYSARLEGQEHLIKILTFSIEPGEKTTLDVVLKRRSKRPLATIKNNKIAIRRNINFATGSEEINPNSYPLLSEIADILIRNPQIRSVRIEGHTDNRGGADYNRKLSEKRAGAVRTWLVDHHVTSNRLTIKGFGPDRPKAPNITASGRAQNRRVEFIIKERN